MWIRISSKRILFAKTMFNIFWLKNVKIFANYVIETTEIWNMTMWQLLNTLSIEMINLSKCEKIFLILTIKKIHVATHATENAIAHNCCSFLSIFEINYRFLRKSFRNDFFESYWKKFQRQKFWINKQNSKSSRKSNDNIEQKQISKCQIMICRRMQIWSTMTRFIDICIYFLEHQFLVNRSMSFHDRFDSKIFKINRTLLHIKYRNPIETINIVKNVVLSLILSIEKCLINTEVQTIHWLKSSSCNIRCWKCISVNCRNFYYSFSIYTRTIISIYL